MVEKIENIFSYGLYEKIGLSIPVHKNRYNLSPIIDIF